jgi:hypothetical protein
LVFLKLQKQRKRKFCHTQANNEGGEFKRDFFRVRGNIDKIFKCEEIRSYEFIKKDKKSDIFQSGTAQLYVPFEHRITTSENK